MFRDRAIVGMCILIVVGLAWAYLIRLDFQMGSHQSALGDAGDEHSALRNAGLPRALSHFRNVVSDDGGHDDGHRGAAHNAVH